MRYYLNVLITILVIGAAAPVGAGDNDDFYEQIEEEIEMEDDGSEEALPEGESSEEDSINTHGAIFEVIDRRLQEAGQCYRELNWVVETHLKGRLLEADKSLRSGIQAQQSASSSKGGGCEKMDADAVKLGGKFDEEEYGQLQMDPQAGLIACKENDLGLSQAGSEIGNQDVRISRNNYDKAKEDYFRGKKSLEKGSNAKYRMEMIGNDIRRSEDATEVYLSRKADEIEIQYEILRNAALAEGANARGRCPD